VDGSGGMKPSLLPVSEAVSVTAAERAMKGWMGQVG
jgi:hypothetical protein